MEAFQQHLARVGLDAAERYGFALAGGYAVQAAGFLQRPSEDIDLFTVWERRSEFETAVGAIVNAYLAAGLSVESERRHDTFTRLTVSDGEQTAKVELGVDMRANEPVRISFGPVLHPDDAEQAVRYGRRPARQRALAQLRGLRIVETAYAVDDLATGLEERCNRRLNQ